jgi:GNAT superfamily N-acetyltransferase
LTIRPARLEDAALIATLVKELAEYERLAEHAVATPDDLAAALFGSSPKAFALIVESEGQPAGFCVYFYMFSTFTGRPGIYVEDVFVRPEFRRRGYGRAFFHHLARKAVDEGCGRVEWAVLNWNEPAIRFYASLGAVPMTEWTTQRLAGDALKNFAENEG